jgi:hypothetical protein
MREFVYLVDPRAASGFDWRYQNDIINATPKLEALAAESAEFWYARKLVWLTTRKQLEQKNIPQQKPLPSYFDQPDRDWKLARLLAKGDTPDLVFYRRRTPEVARPMTLDATAPAWGGLIPPLPADWTAERGPRSKEVFWKIPPELRGKSVRVEMEVASAQVQAVLISVRFEAAHPNIGGFLGYLTTLPARLHLGGKHLRQTEYVLKPYLHPQGGKEFFVLALPPKAERCAIHLKFSKDARAVHFTSFHASFEDQLAGPRGGEELEPESGRDD